MYFTVAPMKPYRKTPTEIKTLYQKSSAFLVFAVCFFGVVFFLQRHRVTGFVGVHLLVIEQCAGKS